MDINVYRGDKFQYQYTKMGDVTARKLTFVVKADKVLTSSRLIEKKNIAAGGADTQILATYDSTHGITVIKVYLLPEDTQDLTASKYYFDLVSEAASVATDLETLDKGDINLEFDVQSPYDGVDLPITGVRFFALRMSSGTDAQMATKKAELLAEDPVPGPGEYIFFNTEANSPYFWNGEDFK